MFPNEWKMITDGSPCRTETTTPAWHTHQPHPPVTPTSTPTATPTCYTLQALPLVLWLMCLVDGCVRWACQVGVSGRCVRWACQVGVAHLPATPTCHAYQLHPPVIPISPMTNVCGGCVRWEWQVGVAGGRDRWAWQCLWGQSHTVTINSVLE